MAKPFHRITQLDGLRGLAIILVLAYHAFNRWSSILIWTSSIKNFFLIKYGFLGVELFFLISGFVIYLTLEHCEHFGEFIFKRWIRLFPAMLIATIIVYFSSPFFLERPAGIPALRDVVPGLLFLEPEVIQSLFGFYPGIIERSFWSLFIEVKFYFVFGALYFLNKKYALICLVVIFLISTIYHQLNVFFPYLYQNPSYFLALILKLADKIFDRIFSFQLFGWFCMGGLIYKYYLSRSIKFLFGAVALLPPTILETTGLNLEAATFCAAIFLLFILCLINKSFQKVISNKFFLFFGFISYPLYLVHENLVIAISLKMNNLESFLPQYLNTISALVVAVILAYIIARYMEPLLRKKIIRGLRNIKLPSLSK